MDNQLKIKELFFDKKMNVIEIANELDCTKQYVSKILSTKYKDDYDKEKNNRSQQRKKQRNIKKSITIKEKRGNVSAEELRYEHEMAVKMMSKGRKMGATGFVYASINVYDVKGNSLVYNSRAGKRPFDAPQRLPLKLNIYR